MKSLDHARIYEVAITNKQGYGITSELVLAKSQKEAMKKMRAYLKSIEFNSVLGVREAKFFKRIIL